MKVHDLTCTTLKICIERNTYSDIKNISNIKTGQTILETKFQTRSFGYLNNIFYKLDNLTLSSYKVINDYLSKFKIIVNKIRSFLIKLKLDKNWFSYLSILYQPR